MTITPTDAYAAGDPAAAQLPDPAPSWDSLAVPGSPIEAPAPPAIPAGAQMMPSGNWVVMADARILTREDKRQLVRISRTQTDGAATAFAVTDWLHRRLITAWSYDLPLPSAEQETLGQLPAVDDDALDKLLDDANKLLFPKPVSPDDYADPDSPTAPSGE